MRFMLLLYDREPTDESPEDEAIFEAYAAFDEEVASHGVYIHGQGLELSPTARALRQTAEGDVMVTDGPFIETREQLGGFYILECLSMEEAQAWAAKIPAAATGRVEVRTMAGHERRLLEQVKDRDTLRYACATFEAVIGFSPKEN